MNTNSPENEDQLSDRRYAEQETKKTWNYIEEVLSDDFLLRDKGFSGRHEVEQVLVIYRAGDRLHPTKGFDFLGPDWNNLDDDTINCMLDERDHAVQKILKSFLKLFDAEGYDAACQYAQTASKYKVLYISRSEDETVQSLQEMSNHGLTGSFTVDILQKYGNYMVIAQYEDLSYYMRDSYEDDDW